MVGNKIQETLRHTSYLSLKRDAIKRYVCHSRSVAATDGKSSSRAERRRTESIEATYSVCTHCCGGLSSDAPTATCHERSPMNINAHFATISVRKSLLEFTISGRIYQTVVYRLLGQCDSVHFLMTKSCSIRQSANLRHATLKLTQCRYRRASGACVSVQ